VWARWANASGAEKFLDNQEQAKTGTPIYIRWYAGIDETWRVVDIESGKTYGIMHIGEVGRRHFLELILRGPGEV
jgi:head-tail adaptor